MQATSSHAQALYIVPAKQRARAASDPSRVKAFSARHSIAQPHEATGPGG